MSQANHQAELRSQGAAPIPGSFLGTPGPASARLRQACAEKGPGGVLGFEEFLSIALYDPEGGYYGSGRARIGDSGGDFYTNASVGPLYGELLAGQIAEVWLAMGRPSPFTVIEQGAHAGKLMADVLRGLDVCSGLKDCWRARIIEPSTTWQARQKTTLQPWQKRVEWVFRAEELSVSAGVHFSNELLDAFPFALVRYDEGVWRERVLGCSGDAFVWQERKPDERLLKAMAHWPVPPVSPFLAEVRPSISTWMKDFSRSLEQGMLLVCDYGYPVEGFFHAARKSGTLWCYHEHQRDENPLDRPGAKDISAHVDFTALSLAAKSMNWQEVGFTDQHHFLVGAAEDWLRASDGEPLTAERQKKLRNLQRLMHPESMGTQFHFWGGSKGLPEGWKPSGFRHARPVVQVC